MLKRILIFLLVTILSLATITAISPALGYEVAVMIGSIIAQPITLALRIGLMIRGLV